MKERKSIRNCRNHIPAEEGFLHGTGGNGVFPDCKSCVYFSGRNCGKDREGSLGAVGHFF